MGEILLSLSYLPTAERLTVVVVKAKNLIWTNDKTTAGKAPLAAWLLLCVAGGSCALAAKPWAPGGISRCRAQRQARHPWPRLGSGALHGGKINLAGETWDPWRGTGNPWGRDVTLRAGGWGTGCETTVGNPRGWTASQIPNGDQGHRVGVGIRRGLMSQVCVSLSPGQLKTGGCRSLTGSLGAWVPAGVARTPSGW